MKYEHEASAPAEVNPMDKLLAKLSEQEAVLTGQREALRSSEDNAALARTLEYINNTTTPPVIVTPANGSSSASTVPTAPTTSPPSLTEEGASSVPASELARLQAELALAKGKIARMDEELAQTRITKHTIDQAIGGASEMDFPLNQVGADRLQQLPTIVRPQPMRDNSWATREDNNSDTSDALSATGFNRARAAFNSGRPSFSASAPMPMAYNQPPAALASAPWQSRGYGQPFIDVPVPYASAPPFHNDRMMPDPDFLMSQRRGPPGRFNNRSSASSYPYASSNSSFDGLTPSSTPYGSGVQTPGFPGMNGMGGMGMSMGGGMNLSVNTNTQGMYGAYSPSPIGTPLSPHAPEFTASGSWKNDVSVLVLLFIACLLC